MKNNSKNKDGQQKQRPPRFLLTVRGDTLKHYGICDGDHLLCEKTKILDENRLTIWKTPTAQVACFAYENFGDISLYVEGYETVRLPKKEVKMLGVAVAVQKSLGVFNEN